MLQSDQIDQLPTPYYVYDLDRIRSAHAGLRSALPEEADLYYSLKANPHPAVLATLRELGCRAEVSSPGELSAALSAGFRAADVLYTGPAKRDQDVATALEGGVRAFSLDSPAGLDQLESAAAEAGAEVRALLRVNAEQPAPRAGLAMTGVSSQFGADLSWVEAEPDRFGDRRHVQVDGLHLYMGTNLLDEDALVTQFGLALAVAHRVEAATGTRYATLDLGGGFGAPYARVGELPRFPTLRGKLEALLDESAAGWRERRPRVVFESGRHLTATCGRLYTRVLEVKQSQGRRIVLLDTGIHHLGGMSGLRRLPRIAPDVLPAGPGGERHGAAIVGPLCTPLDSWAQNGELPDVAPGDLLAVPNVGAYALYASLVLFLGHPMPEEVAIAGGQVVARDQLQLSRRVTG